MCVVDNETVLDKDFIKSWFWWLDKELNTWLHHGTVYSKNACQPFVFAIPSWCAERIHPFCVMSVSPRFVSCLPWRNIPSYYIRACWPCPCPLAGKVNVKVMLSHIIMFCGRALCNAPCIYTSHAAAFMCWIHSRTIKYYSVLRSPFYSTCLHKTRRHTLLLRNNKMH